MEETGTDLYFYTRRPRGEQELFPWDFIDAGPSRRFLLEEWHRAMKAEVTPNCHRECSVCGAAKFGCGVCYNVTDAGREPRAGTGKSYVYPVPGCNPVPGLSAEESGRIPAGEGGSGPDGSEEI
jgi:hypothetical protein